jgi:hypothetical protein
VDPVVEAIQWCKSEPVSPFSRLFFASLNFLFESADDPTLPLEDVYGSQLNYAKQVLTCVIQAVQKAHEQLRDNGVATILLASLYHPTLIIPATFSHAVESSAHPIPKGTRRNYNRLTTRTKIRLICEILRASLNALSQPHKSVSAALPQQMDGQWRKRYFLRRRVFTSPDFSLLSNMVELLTYSPGILEQGAGPIINSLDINHILSIWRAAKVAGTVLIYDEVHTC